MSPKLRAFSPKPKNGNKKKEGGAFCIVVDDDGA